MTREDAPILAAMAEVKEGNMTTLTTMKTPLGSQVLAPVSRAISSISQGMTVQ
jgi:hypothetical protein